jgi:hypothetical protein
MSAQPPSPSATYVAQTLRPILEARSAGPRPGEGRGFGPLGFGPASFRADAPWRLEPGQDSLPFTFIVRDGPAEEVRARLTAIEVYEAPADGRPWAQKDWRLVERFGDGLGAIDRRFWTYRPSPAVPLGPPPALALDRFRTAVPGQPLQLKVVFQGSRQKTPRRRQGFQESHYLSIYLATAPLPRRRAPQWYYGDTHYHSSYTNDVKEFGNPIPDTRAAGECIGLDWLVTTDHSVDLADTNPYWEDRLTATRWGDLGQEVQANSDDRLRLLRGEEVTVVGIPGDGDNTLHMLVLGTGLERLIPGAFAEQNLLAEVAAQLSEFTRELYAHLFGPIYNLEAVLSGVDQAGQAEPALLGRSVQAQGALAFAAHPASNAQAPGGTWEFYDLLQPIQGVEAWNGRPRRHTADQQSPFEHWQPGGDWADGSDSKAIATWDQQLRQRAGSDDPCFVLLAGSDAHGAFNYSTGWGMDWDGLRADDNALGKVRTLLYLPERAPGGTRQAPSEAEVVAALRGASCVVTDGPVLNLTLRCGGAEATLGQVLEVSGDATVEARVQADSSPEFGAVEEVEVCYYLQGMAGTASTSLAFHPGQSIPIAEDLPPGPGYVRLATVTHRDGETFRCFTNPVYIRPAGPGRRRLRVRCVEW